MRKGREVDLIQASCPEKATISKVLHIRIDRLFLSNIEKTKPLLRTVTQQMSLFSTDVPPSIHNST